MEKEQFDVYCVNTGKTIRVNGGESLLEIYKLANPRLAHRPICAYVNNKTEELKYRVFGNKIAYRTFPISRILLPAR